MAKKRYWADLTAAEFRELDTAAVIGVLPVGAIEQHGPHLPLSVDTDLVEETVRRTLPLLDETQEVLFLPTMAIGKSNEHLAFAGTLSLSAETLIRLWMDVGASIARAGVRRLVLLNGHGGNVSAMDIVARDLRAAHAMLTAHCSWFSFSGSEKLLDEHEYRHGIHGGMSETSAMLTTKPELVRMDLTQDFRSRGEDWADKYEQLGVGGSKAKLGWLMHDLNEHGVAGNAAAATAEQGEKLLDNAARGFAQFLLEFADLPLPPKTTFEI